MPDREFASGKLRTDYISIRSSTPASSPLEVRKLPAISANDLLGITLDEIKKSKLNPSSSYSQMTGFSIANSPIHFSKITGAEVDVAEYLGVVGQPLDGRGLNQLLLSITPNVTFGLDTGDIILDWGRVEDPKFQYTIPNHIRHFGLAWRVFNNERLFLREQINRWHKKVPDEGLFPSGVMPIVHFMEFHGKKKWIFNNLANQPYKDLVFPFISDEYSPLDPQWLSSVVGVWAAAHFSPDVTNAWEKSAKYKEGGRNRGIGTTQVALHAVNQGFQLLEGSFVDKVIEYCAK